MKLGRYHSLKKAVSQERYIMLDGPKMARLSEKKYIVEESPKWKFCGIR